VFFGPGNQTIKKYCEDYTVIIQEDGKPRTASWAGPGIFAQCPGHLIITTFKRKQSSWSHYTTYQIFTIMVCCVRIFTWQKNKLEKNIFWFNLKNEVTWLP